MRKTWTMGLVAMLAVLICTQAVHAGDQDFTLINKTGVEIHKVHVSPHDTESWGEDVMGKDTLADGDSVEIKFSREEAAEDWDLKITDKAGNAISWGNLRLTKISKITLFLENGKATATLE